MRNRTLARRLIAAVVFLASLVPAAALPQDAGTPEGAPALKKWDATGTIGWYHRHITAGLYDPPTNSLFAGATLGRYWTENIKTEVEVATGGRSDHSYYWEPSFPSGPYLVPATLDVSDVQVSAAQFYQFFHNAWVHPFLGVGLVYEREGHSAARPAQQVPTYSTGSSKPDGWISVSAWSRDWTTSQVEPFVLGGFKAYVSRRAFFRADLRIAARGGASATNARIGFGIDF